MTAPHSTAPHSAQPRQPWLRRALASLTAAVLVFAMSALPASAHDVLVSSDPANGDSFDTAPETVSFTFDNPIQNYEPVLRVIGPNQNNFAGTPTIEGRTISAKFSPGPAGEYRGVFRIVSSDGHPISGQVSFSLTEAAAGDATGTPVEESSNAEVDGGEPGGGVNVWLWVIIGAVIVLIGGGIVIAVRRPTT